MLILRLMADRNSLENNPMYRKLMEMRNTIVAEIVNEFLNKSTQLIATIEKNELFDPNLDKCFKELKESSAKIGAHKVNNKVNQTIQHLQRGNRQSAMVSFHQMKMELDTVQERLNAYFKLGYQLKVAVEAIDKQKKK
ncbi:hypothetical protein JRO89_XS05G0239900 [Xanthoceras sorbifolium]|uniref:Histidine-containing phosphotransfer protein n=1 Tax=Xanthoceras sorbifolium TaxID=99658 RepID=A0ABQ8I2Z9_9ROSI|nr:hypothetical protein JRO89_XS05G0239900 [Xanthoceras sorbifolium]